MAKIIVTAQVEDSASWEQGFRTHGDLFEEYTATSISFSNADNEVAILWEVADPDKMLSLIDTPATAEAMATDGVKRETVKIYVLDNEF